MSGNALSPSIHAEHDIVYMREAIALAESALYVPSPNPRVGCVIVREARVIGRGATQAVGHAHAEIVALEDAQRNGESVVGATVYISLEPCSHHGKTPPCVDALIQAQVSRVVFAHLDPNPQVAGRGMRMLKQAGIDVTVGVLVDQALDVNPGFVSRMTRGIPYVWLKIAASLDAQTALINGDSQWITQSAARDDGHHWRARSCMVLTGIGTVRTDNPLLDVRAVTTPRQPKLGIVDPRFEIDPHARVFDSLKQDKPRSIVIFVADDHVNPAKRAQLIDQGVQVICLPNHSTPKRLSLPEASSPPRPRVDMGAMMRWLGEHDVNELHVEAGAGLNGAIWQAGYVDELLLYLAPTFLGLGKPMLAIPGIDTLDQATHMSFVQVTPVGDDVRVRVRHTDHWDQLRTCLHAMDAH